MPTKIPTASPSGILRGAQQKQQQKARMNRNAFATPNSNVDTSQLKRGVSSSAALMTAGSATVTGPRATTVAPVYTKKARPEASTSSEAGEIEGLITESENQSEISTACDEGVELRVGKKPNASTKPPADSGVVETGVQFSSEHPVSSTELILQGLNHDTAESTAVVEVKAPAAKKEKKKMSLKPAEKESTKKKPAKSRKIVKEAETEGKKGALIQSRLSWGKSTDGKLATKADEGLSDVARNPPVIAETKKPAIKVADDSQDTLEVFVKKETERVEVEAFDVEMEERIVPQVAPSDLLCFDENEEEEDAVPPPRDEQQAQTLSQPAESAIATAMKDPGSEIQRNSEAVAPNPTKFETSSKRETPPAEKSGKKSKREEFLRKAQEGKLSPYPLSELSTHRELRGHKSIDLPNDYLIEGKMMYACARMNQFTAITQVDTGDRSKGIPMPVFPPIVADCCETFSVLCSLAFSSVSSQGELHRLLGKGTSSIGLDWWLHTASWLHELSKSHWKFDIKTKQRPKVSEVVKCLGLDTYFPGNDLRSENFEVVMYHRVDKALQLVQQLRDYLDVKKQQVEAQRNDSMNEKQRMKRGRESEDKQLRQTKGFVIVSGDYTVSVFAIVPDKNFPHGALCILDSHGSFPWSGWKTCLSSFADFKEDRTPIGANEVADSDHFCKVLFALLEENRSKDFSPHSPLLKANRPSQQQQKQSPQAGVKESPAGKVVALAIDSDDDAEVKEVEIKLSDTTNENGGGVGAGRSGGLSKHAMTWTPIYDIPKVAGASNENYFPPLKSEEIVFLATKCATRFLARPGVRKNLERQASWIKKFPYDYVVKGIKDSYLASDGAKSGGARSSGGNRVAS